MNRTYLNDLEVSKIEQFCADEVLFDAVRKVLLAGIYYHGTPEQGLSSSKEITNGAYSLVANSTTYPIDDVLVGQHIKAQWAGLNALKNALDDLKTIKTETKEVESPYNPGI